MKGKIEVKNLGVVYDKGICAVKNLNFKVNHGEFVCLIGPSGCGKTTVINAIAGFIKSKSGKVLLDDKQLTKINSKIGMVFQQPTLFFWKTVSGNIEFGSRIKSFDKRQGKKLVKKYIKLIGLQGFEEAYPSELSGGMQRRVAIARVLANDPEIILMDEPFDSLDAQTKAKTQRWLLDIWDKNKKTIIFVTHDIEEAIFLADRIIVMTKRPGRIKKELKIDLPRPRTFETTLQEKYQKYKSQIFELLDIP